MTRNILLLIHCLMLRALIWGGFFVRSLFCNSVYSVLSSFAIMLRRKREMLYFNCLPDTVNVMWLFLAVLWVRLQCVIRGLSCKPNIYMS